MHRRALVTVLSVSAALGALSPAAAAADAGPPKVEFPKHCFVVIGPPDGPVPIVVGATLCLVDWATP